MISLIGLTYLSSGNSTFNMLPISLAPQHTGAVSFPLLQVRRSFISLSVPHYLPP